MVGIVKYQSNQQFGELQNNVIQEDQAEILAFALAEFYPPPPDILPATSLLTNPEATPMNGVPTTFEEFADLLLPYLPTSVISVNGESGVVVLTPTDIGLGNVDDTSDADKPISDATQTAINYLQDQIDDNDLDITALQGAVVSLAGSVTSLSTSKLDAALASASIFVGSAGGVATARSISGFFTLDNLGVAAVVTGSFVNADINNAAGIALTKLAATTASKALVSDGSGFIVASATSAAQIGFLSTVTSDVQTQINVSMQSTLNQLLTAMGSTMLAITVNGEVPPVAAKTLSDNAGAYNAIYIPRAMTITGVILFMQTQGNYTSDQTNQVGLYSYNAGTGVATLVAQSANDGNLWKATTRTFITVPFTGTYAAAAGTYFIATLYNNSAQVTAPQLLATSYGTSFPVYGLPNSGKVVFDTGSNNALPSSVTLSAASASTSGAWAAVY